MTKAAGVVEGIPLCQTCYRKLTVRTVCDNCGGNVRTTPGAKPVLCKPCRTKVGRVCVIHGGLFFGPAAGLRDGGAVCVNCWSRTKPKKICSACGNESHYVSRAPSVGYMEPVCTTCRTMKYPRCAECKTRRPSAGKDPEGRDLCNICIGRGGEPFMCPVCEKEGRMHSRACCEECYRTDFARRRIDEATGKIRKDWAKELFRAFCDNALSTMEPKQMAHKIDSSFRIFAAMEEACAGPEDITVERLFDLSAGRTWIERTLPFSFLMKRGLLPPESQDRFRRMRWKKMAENIIRKDEGKWYESILKGFHSYLVDDIQARYRRRGWKGAKERFKDATVCNNLTAAREFLRFCDTSGMVDIRQVSTDHVDKFLLNNPGWVGIHTFIRFLNRHGKLFGRIKPEFPGCEPTLEHVLDPARRRNLLRMWFAAPDEELKEALVCVLMLRYAQRLQKLLRLRLTDLLRDKEGMFVMKFAKEELRIDRATGTLIGRYLAVRRTVNTFDDPATNPYLFPGQKFGCHMSVNGAWHHLARYGVTARQLFSTAVSEFSRRGLNNPKVLTIGLGVSGATGENYRKLSNPQFAKNLRRMEGKHGKR